MVKPGKVENYSDRPVPACETCYRRRSCERYEEGSFCTMWQSKAPEQREPDPNDLWKRGEEVEF